MVNFAGGGRDRRGQGWLLRRITKVNGLHDRALAHRVVKFVLPVLLVFEGNWQRIIVPVHSRSIREASRATFAERAGTIAERCRGRSAKKERGGVRVR